MDLRRQIALVRSWLPLLIVSAVLAAGAAYVVSNVQEKVYEAKAKLIVGQSLSGNPDYYQLLVSQRLSALYALAATAAPRLEAVIEELGLEDTVDELARRIRADAPLDSPLLTISVQDSDPARAAAIANTLAEQAVTASKAQGQVSDFQASIAADLTAVQEQIRSTQARVQTLSAVASPTPEQQAELATLEDRLVSLRATYATLLSFSSGTTANLLSVFEMAAPPTSPISPRPLLNTLIAAIVGLLIAVFLVAVLEYFDDSIKTQDDIKELVGLNTLGSIGRMRGARDTMYRLAALLYPRSGAAEAYRTLRTNIEFTAVDAPMRTLLVTSSVPGEGKTVTAANLAVVFAQGGRRVLLVDADLRKPGIHQMFNLANVRGLTTLLRDEEMSLDSVSQSTEEANLRVLTTGPLPPNPAELLGSQRMRTVLDRLVGAGDLVILDSPPLQAVTDSAILSSFLDGTLLVVDAKRSRRRSVRLACESLTRAGANVIGAVLNRDTNRTQDAYADYYGSKELPDALTAASSTSRKRTAS